MIRLTQARKKIIEIILKTASPISAEEIIRLLPVNKTTVYRQLHALTYAGLINEVDLADRKKRYEMSDLTHHHHLVCLKCQKVEDINLDDHLFSQEKKIEKDKQFKISKHNLEFFGYCLNCQ
ncbi:hypothetical protein A2W14_00810 [Candidatus Gottesmanbacteria bacterium RBG_16_37_8]|uniref:Transcriptional repressor n=1 Tax=Candidatus Gottesmanbacteria bacterium RBG_16_37_8 TaxID=1798371 RepID=A0A1F5YV26_9BACT|nr:MAG: hypothetical protein A2W14_00810 [Candidatus Gottesmanbacteria bacterium RBG_16_37_8]